MPVLQRERPQPCLNSHELSDARANYRTGLYLSKVGGMLSEGICRVKIPSEQLLHLHKHALCPI